MTMCINPPVRNYDEPQIINGASPSPPQCLLRIVFSNGVSKKNSMFSTKSPSNTLFSNTLRQRLESIDVRSCHYGTYELIRKV